MFAYKTIKKLFITIATIGIIIGLGSIVICNMLSRSYDRNGEKYYCNEFLPESYNGIVFRKTDHHGALDFEIIAADSTEYRYHVYIEKNEKFITEISQKDAIMKPTCFTNTNTTLIKSATCGFHHTIENLI